MIETYNQKIKKHVANREANNPSIGTGIANANIDQKADNLGTSTVPRHRYSKQTQMEKRTTIGTTDVDHGADDPGTGTVQKSGQL